MIPLKLPAQFMRHNVWLLGLFALGLTLLSLGGDPWREALRYERAAIVAGEYWRFVTGHFVHGGWRHLLLNLAGLAIMRLLFPRGYSAAEWCLVVLTSLIAIDAGFWWLQPQLQWYVGLSGVLHGVLAAGAVAWWRTESKFMAAALSSLVVGKLCWEQLQGALPLVGDLPVIVDAHLYGAVGGAWVGLALQGLKVRKTKVAGADKHDASSV